MTAAMTPGQDQGRSSGLPAFLSAVYDLPGTPAAHLRHVTADEAASLGSMIAAMPPWLGYPGMTADGLATFLAQTEPGAPRFAIHLAGPNGDVPTASNSRAGNPAMGTITVRTNWLRGPYIQLLALSPQAQGAGFGSRLLQFVEAEARRDWQRQLWVAATATNVGALRFYERHGFVRTAEIDGLVADGICEILLRKPLTYGAGG